MKKIIFLIPNLNGGGAEKILLDTVKNLDKKKYSIEIKCIFNKGLLIGDIPDDVEYSYIFDWFKEENLFTKILLSLILRILKIIPADILYLLFIKKQYDLEIAFLEGISTKIISGSYNVSKKIAWVHIDPLKLHYSKKAYINTNSEKRAYQSFDKICCVSSDVKKSLDYLYDTCSKSIVQLNVLNDQQVKRDSLKEIEEFRFENNNFNIISVGRLMPQKNFQMLLKVVNDLIKENFKINLYILGEGFEREKLEKYIDENNLKDNIKLLGFISNPYPYINKSDLFICSSITEGFSTVVSESIVLGVPVLTTDCAGMRDILNESEYGLIVENNENGLKKGLVKILTDNEFYMLLKDKANERSAFFDKNKRIKELEYLFDFL